MPAPSPLAGEGRGGEALGQNLPPGEAEPLPTLDSLTVASDIRAFLRPAVPAALRQAALAKFWSLDPAIRDFREMADYDWDFNTPGGAPGYGPLETTIEEVEKLLARIIPPRPAEGEGDDGEGARRAEGPSPCPSPASGRGNAEVPPDMVADGSGDPATSPLPRAGEGQGEGLSSVQAAEARVPTPRPRRHGSAIPT